MTVRSYCCFYTEPHPGVINFVIMVFYKIHRAFRDRVWHFVTGFEITPKIDGESVIRIKTRTRKSTKHCWRSAATGVTSGKVGPSLQKFPTAADFNRINISVICVQHSKSNKENVDNLL